jgi:glycosyltransferase involved in cell wall biosynthesis
MQIGTGMQNKLLEAMAMGIPCVTTPIASEALDVTPGQELLVGSTAEELTKHIKFLLNNPTDAKIIGEQGRNMVSNSYSWENAVNTLNELITLPR